MLLILWFQHSSGSNNIERIIGYIANSKTLNLNITLQLRLYQMVVVPTSSLATIHDASRNDLSVILMMIVVTVQMNTQIAYDQLAAPPSLPATISAVFWRNGNVMAIMIVVILAMSEIAVSWIQVSLSESWTLFPHVWFTLRGLGSLKSLDCKLSSGEHYPAFEQPVPAALHTMGPCWWLSTIIGLQCVLKDYRWLQITDGCVFIWSYIFFLPQL